MCHSYLIGSNGYAPLVGFAHSHHALAWSLTVVQVPVVISDEVVACSCLCRLWTGMIGLALLLGPQQAVTLFSEVVAIGLTPQAVNGEAGRARWRQPGEWCA